MFCLFMHPVIRVSFLGNRGFLTVLIWQDLGGFGRDWQKRSQFLKLEIEANPKKYADGIRSTASYYCPYYYGLVKTQSILLLFHSQWRLQLSPQPQPPGCHLPRLHPNDHIGRKEIT